jgi:hypothetical protein
MGLDPAEKNWFSRHPVATTIMVIILIAAAGTALKLLQQIYLPVEEREYTTPVFLNESYEEVDGQFNIESELTREQQDELFDSKYKYNVVKWTCEPISCQKLLGKHTLKLICKERGMTEDVRIAMKEDCSDVVVQSEVTVIFQLLSKTTGEYYLGRSGTIVKE